MAGAWKEVGTGERLVPAETYRVRLSIRAPYTGAVTGALAAAFKAHAFTHDLAILKIEHAPPLFSSRGVLQPFPYIVTLRVREAPGIVQAGLDPRAVWALAGLVATTLLSFAIVSKKLERFVEIAAREVRDTAKEILNPGFVILAFVAAVLFFKKGGS